MSMPTNHTSNPAPYLRAAMQRVQVGPTPRPSTLSCGLRCWEPIVKDLAALFMEVVFEKSGINPEPYTMNPKTLNPKTLFQGCQDFETYM